MQAGRKPGDVRPIGRGLVEQFVAADMNCDGTLGFGDINPMILALSAPSAWQAAYPSCDILNGDINGDGSVTMGDINPFVALVSGGQGK